MNKITLNNTPVVFNEAEHTYHLGPRQLNGITTTILDWAFPDTYASIPDSVLAKAAEHGHYVHSCIELASVVGPTPDCPESQQFLDIIAERRLSVLRHEYIVTDSRHFASPIDIVLTDADGGVILADIKATSQLHEPRVRLQLSIYAWMFSLVNPDTPVKGIAAIWLPRPVYGSPAYVPLDIIPADIIAEMVEAYLNGHTPERFADIYDPQPELPAEYRDMVEAIAVQEQQARLIKERTDTMKRTLLKVFRDNGIKRLANDRLTITYVAPTTRSSVDSKRLKAEQPDIYNQYVRTSNVSDTIKITLHND